MTSESTVTLADFPKRSAEEWRAAVVKALKGGDPARLRRTTLDGIALEPLYGASDAGRLVAGAAAARPWTVVQRVDHPDAAAANGLALADLEGGAAGLELVFAGGAGARPHGLADFADATLDRLFADVLPDLIALRIDAGDDTQAAARAVAAAAGRRGIAPRRLSLALADDPIGRLAARGRIAPAVPQAIVAAAATAAALDLTAAGGTVLAADGRATHEAGGTDVQELAGVLAAAVAYWRGLADAGLGLEDAAGLIGFVLAVDQDQFRTIAKLRALRLLWAAVQQAAGIAPRTARIHAETAWRAMSRVGPHVNLLRTTIAAFAAGVGGADSVTVLPFTAAVGLPDAFARRLARNTQTILIEESNVYRVADPAAGSGLVEAETDALAARAWALFQEIEAEGGLAAAVAAGSWQARVAAVAAERAKAVARRRQPLTGVSEFPDIGELPVAVIDVAAPAAPGRPAAATAPAMPPHRLAEPFEALRERAAAATPRVFLANLGRIPDFNARSTWAKNLFEAGGIAAPSNDGFADADALVAAFRAAGTPLACLCSSDAVYAERAAATAAALKAAGAGTVVLAGKPADAEAEAAYRAAGVDLFVHVGIDVVATLADLQRRLAAV